MPWRREPAPAVTWLLFFGHDHEHDGQRARFLPHRGDQILGRVPFRERMFVEFIDLSSNAFVDALLQTSMKTRQARSALRSSREVATLRLQANNRSR
jgi:hypothetical protein